MQEKSFGLSNNALKIIAMLSMLIDHTGLMIFPEYKIFRIIGRLAFPIFAYMIAEGCFYTKKQKKVFSARCRYGCRMSGSLYFCGTFLIS